MMYVPKPGTSLIVMLPAEQMRAEVTKVLDRHTVIVRLGQPMMRTHNFRKDDLVACRRTLGELGEVWEAMAPRGEPQSAPHDDLPKSSKKPDKTTRDAPISTKPAKDNVTKLVVNNVRRPKP